MPVQAHTVRARTGVYFITHLIKILGMPSTCMGVCTGAINPFINF